MAEIISDDVFIHGILPFMDYQEFFAFSAVNRRFFRMSRESKPTFEVNLTTKRSLIGFAKFFPNLRFNSYDGRAPSGPIADETRDALRKMTRVTTFGCPIGPFISAINGSECLKYLEIDEVLQETLKLPALTNLRVKYYHGSYDGLPNLRELRIDSDRSLPLKKITNLPELTHCYSRSKFTDLSWKYLPPKIEKLSWSFSKTIFIKKEKNADELLMEMDSVTDTESDTDEYSFDPLYEFIRGDCDSDCDCCGGGYDSDSDCSCGC